MSDPSDRTLSDAENAAKHSHEALRVARSAPDRRKLIDRLVDRYPDDGNAAGLRDDAASMALADYVDELEERAQKAWSEGREAGWKDGLAHAHMIECQRDDLASQLSALRSDLGDESDQLEPGPNYDAAMLGGMLAPLLEAIEPHAAKVRAISGMPDPIERAFLSALAGMGVPIYDLKPDDAIDECTRQLWRIAQSAVRTRPQEGGAA